MYLLVDVFINILLCSFVYIYYNFSMAFNMYRKNMVAEIETELRATIFLLTFVVSYNNV